MISSPNSLLRLQNTLDLYNHHSNINPNFQGPNNNKIWNSNISCEKENNCELVDPAGLANFRLAGEYSNPMRPLHNLIQRSHYHQSPPSSMMNVSSRSSCSSSSLLNLHMELPSNQNNSFSVPLWPEEEKMVGMKRSYPFAVDNSTTTAIIQPFGRSEESTSFGINGAAATTTTPLNPNFRGSSSWDSSVAEAKKNKKENGDFNGDFLTLAPPPITALTISPNNSNLLQTHRPPFYNCQSFDFTSLPYQGIIENEIDEARNEVVQPFYSFLPPAIIQIGQPITTCNNGAADFGDNVIDLNLKL